MNRMDFLRVNLPKGYDGALIFTEQNRRYLTDFQATDGALIVSRERALLFADSRYFEAAGKCARDCEVRLMRDFRHELPRALAELNIGSLCLEEAISVREARVMAEYCKKSVVKPCEGLDGILKAMRAVKDDGEIACIRKAQKITDAAFEYACGMIKEGMTERSLALEIEFFMRENGAERTSFDLIAISGKNTSLPHGVPTDKAICRGDLITMDTGCVVDGYCSDMTRTVALGDIGDKQRQVYETVLAAQRAAIAAVHAGVAASEVDRAARDVICGAGYGDFFGHATGHGVGIDIHEWPTLSRDTDYRLGEGVIVTIEPGIYLPGEFGVRIEDMVCVTQGGCLDLTHSPKELRIL